MRVCGQGAEGAVRLHAPISRRARKGEGVNRRRKLWEGLIASFDRRRKLYHLNNSSGVAPLGYYVTGTSSTVSDSISITRPLWN